MPYLSAAGWLRTEAAICSILSQVLVATVCVISPIQCCEFCKYRFGQSNVLAEVRPRFPLYGGWKTEFTFGYSLPLTSIMTKVKGGVQLEALFSSPFNNVVVDDLTVKVWLTWPSVIAAVLDL